MKQSISRKFIESLLSLTSLSSPKLNGYQETILVNLHDKELVATNGATLVMHDISYQDHDNLTAIFGRELDSDKTIVLSSEALKNLKVLLKNKKQQNFFVSRGTFEELVIGDSSGMTVTSSVTNYYPNYHQVIPSSEKLSEAITFSIDFEKLKKLMDAMESDGKKGCITLRFIAENAPIVIDHKAVEDFGKIKNLIMPVSRK